MSKTPLFIAIFLLISIGALFYITKAQKQDMQEMRQQSQKEPTAQQKSGTAHTIKMIKDAFSPETITVKKGDTVVWVNEDSDFRWPASNIHPTHGIYPEFDPREPTVPGGEWSFKFDKTGEWRYHDHLIPRLRGIVTVTE